MSNPNLQKIIKLTQTQYDILSNGGTVGDYTGLNDNYLYLIQDDTEYSTATNIQNGSGTGALQERQDGTSGTIDFTNKNPNATAIDSSLTGQITFGGVGNYAASFGGKSQASGKRSFAHGTTTIAKGAYSHAEGDNSVALGTDSHAEGIVTTAAGVGSHSEGSSTVVASAAVAAHAEGFTTYADGVYTHAEGVYNKVKGDNAHVEGSNNTVGSYESGGGGGDLPTPGTPVNAEGMGSHAEGCLNKITGTYSHAEGTGNTISGSYSHAEGGSNNIAAGFAHAEGNTNTITANGNYGHVEGYGSEVTNVGGHAEGLYGHAYADYSHAEGAATYARGQYSHAEGQNTQTTSTAVAAHAEGQYTTANGQASHTGGYYTTANYDYQTIVGKFNNNQSNSLFEVGNGTSESDRRNALTVYKDGHAEIGLMGSTNSSIATRSYVNTSISALNIENGSGTNAVQEKRSHTSINFTGRNANAEALDSTLSTTIITGGTGENAASFNGNTMSVGSRTFAINNKTIAKGDESMAQGYCSVALGSGSHAEGQQTVSYGGASHSEGTLTQAIGNNSHAEGSGTIANSLNSHVEGYATQTLISDSTIPNIPAYGNDGSSGGSGSTPGTGGTTDAQVGDGAHAEGSHTTAVGNFAHAEGTNTWASGASSHAEGYGSQATYDYAHAEGYNTLASGYGSHSTGLHTIASGNYSFTQGQQTEAVYNLSSAFGKGTHTDYENQMSIGRWNSYETSALFVVGNGNSHNDRSTAFKVDKDGHAEVGAEGVYDVTKALTAGSAISGYTYCYESNITAAQFDTIYNLLTSGKTMSQTDYNSHTTPVSKTWTRTTHEINGTSYNSINCSVSGPLFDLVKVGDNVYVYSYTSSYNVIVHSAGSDADICSALGMSSGNPLAVATIQQVYQVKSAIPTKTSQLTNDSGFATLSSVSSQEHNYRYMHNVRLYLADKMLIRTNYVLSKTQNSSYAGTSPSSLGNLARALNYAGATSQTTAIPATGMIYIDANTTGIVTGIYSVSNLATASYVFVCYLPLVTSSGSDATIAVTVPTESTVQLSSLGTPTVTGYVKAV